ncbi:MAG: hypothetical protein ABI274_05290, partial [Ktedonobacterales bacterium]
MSQSSSDTPNSAAGVTAAAMAAQATSDTANAPITAPGGFPHFSREPGAPLTSRERNRRIGLGLLTAGALLFAYAAWTPWFLAGGSTPTLPPPVIVGLNPGEIAAPPLAMLYGAQTAFLIWSILSVLGLLLTPLLWQRSAPILKVVGAVAWLTWLVGIIYLSSITIRTLTQNFALLNPSYVTVLPASNYEPYTILTTQPAFGVWLALLALLAAGVGGFVALTSWVRSLTRRFLTASAPDTTVVLPVGGASAAPQAASTGEGGQPSLRATLPGAGALTGGMLLWVWGFFLLPWATLNCTQIPLLMGSCQGLAVNSVLSIGIFDAKVNGQQVIDPAIGLFAIGALLLGGAAFTLIGVWRRDITRTLCIWASLWLLLAVASALLAIHGASVIVARPTAFQLQNGIWRGDTGVLVVFLGLLLVAVGLIPLWAVAVV